MSAPDLRHLECCDLSLCLCDTPEEKRLKAFVCLVTVIAGELDRYCLEEYTERSGVALNIVGHTYTQWTKLVRILAYSQVPENDEVIASELFDSFTRLVEGYLAGVLLTSTHGGLEEAWLDSFRRVIRGAA